MWVWGLFRRTQTWTPFKCWAHRVNSLLMATTVCVKSKYSLLLPEAKCERTSFEDRVRWNPYRRRLGMQKLRWFILCFAVRVLCQNLVVLADLDLEYMHFNYGVCFDPFQANLSNFIQQKPLVGQETSRFSIGMFVWGSSSYNGLKKKCDLVKVKYDENIYFFCQGIWFKGVNCNFTVELNEFRPPPQQKKISFSCSWVEMLNT